MRLIYLYLISIRQLLCVRFLHLLCSVFGYSHEWNLLRLETQPQGRVPRLPVHTSCVCIRTGTCGGTDQLCEFCSCPSVVGPAGPSTRAAYGTAALGRPVSLYIRAGTHAAPLNQIGAVKFRPWWSDPRHACLDLPRAMWRGGMERSWREVRLLMPNQTLLCGWKKKRTISDYCLISVWTSKMSQFSLLYQIWNDIWLIRKTKQNINLCLFFLFQNPPGVHCGSVCIFNPPPVEKCWSCW